MVKKRMPTKIVAGALAAILLLHVVAIQRSWYWAYIWLDIPMHILGGIWVALFFAWLVRRYPALGFSYERSNFGGSLLATLGFVALFGIAWECYEFAYDIFLSSTRSYALLMQLGAADTVSDLFFDIFGGTIGFLLSRYFLARRDT